MSIDFKEAWTDCLSHREYFRSSHQISSLLSYPHFGYLWTLWWWMKMKIRSIVLFWNQCHFRIIKCNTWCSLSPNLGSNEFELFQTTWMIEKPQLSLWSSMGWSSKYWPISLNLGFIFFFLIKIRKLNTFLPSNHTLAAFFWSLLGKMQCLRRYCTL